MNTNSKYQSFRVYEVNVAGSRRIVELLSREEANRYVRRGELIEFIDVDGKTPCFAEIHVRGTKPMPLGTRSITDLGATLVVVSNTAFSRPEVQALAGTNFKHGRSRTARMSEEQRMERRDKRGKPLPLEDTVERAQNKAKAWAQMGSALQELVREGVAA